MIAAVAPLAGPARADSAGDSEIRDVSAETTELRAVHHHDWSPKGVRFRIPVR